jgi:hypothetical protein
LFINHQQLQLLLLAAHLAAELAEVLGVLADLHLLDLLTETRSIASSVLAHNANLLGALRLQQQRQQLQQCQQGSSRDAQKLLRHHEHLIYCINASRQATNSELQKETQTAMQGQCCSQGPQRFCCSPSWLASLHVAKGRAGAAASAFARDRRRKLEEVIGLNGFKLGMLLVHSNETGELVRAICKRLCLL